MKNLLLFLCIFLIGCEQLQEAKKPQKKFDVKVDVIVHNLYIAWPLTENQPSKRQRMKLRKVMDILKQADDVEISLVPVFDVPVSNKYVHERIHVIREKLLKMGVGANKIFILKNIKPEERQSPGVNMIIHEFKMDIPKCDIWDDYVGDFDINKDIPNFGCSNANVFGKMVANPASIIKYRKTETDTTLAIQAVDNYISANDISAIDKQNGGAIDSNGLKNSAAAVNNLSGLTANAGRIGSASARTANRINNSL